MAGDDIRAAFKIDSTAEKTTLTELLEARRGNPPVVAVEKLVVVVQQDRILVFRDEIEHALN